MGVGGFGLLHMLLVFQIDGGDGIGWTTLNHHMARVKSLIYCQNQTAGMACVNVST